MTPRARVERWALAALRVSVAAFLLVCGLRLGPPWAAAALVPTVGRSVAALEVLLSGIITLGLWRRWSYGAALLAHLGSLLFLWRQLRDPWTLLIAGLPLCGALVALYLLRERDTWTLEAWLAWRRPWRVVR